MECASAGEGSRFGVECLRGNHNNTNGDHTMVTIPMTIATSDTIIVIIKNKRGRFFSRKKVPNQTDRIGKITKLMGEFLKAKKQQSKCCLVENVTTEKKTKKTNKQTNWRIFLWRGSALGGECHSGNRNNPVLPTDLVITHLQRGFSNKQTEKKQKQIWKYDLDTSKVAKTGKQDKKTLTQPI